MCWCRVLKNIFYFSPMTNDDFLTLLQKETSRFNELVQTNDGDWIVKGFIDLYRRIYTISIDTKVVSKVLELLIYPELHKWAENNNFIIEPAAKQIFYPDYTFVHRDTGQKFAVDIKTTVRDKNGRIKGMTLGTFQGYFRERDKKKTSNYPYNEYSGHFIVGALYSQTTEATDEKRVYSLDELDNIKSVVKNFDFFAQYKYKVASWVPGSGNTKNIGAINNIEDIKNGNGPFAKLGINVFDDYWMYYQTNSMAEDGKPPYKNLKEYAEYKKNNIEILAKNEDFIKQLPTDDEAGLTQKEDDNIE